MKARKHNYEIGKVYGVKKLLNIFRDNNKLIAFVECIYCGKQSYVRPNSLFHEKYISCNCRNKSVNSEYYKSRLYKTYHNMLYRCYNENSQEYYNYGGKGIRVCEEWLGELGFLNFREWALSNNYNDNLTIDRIDSDQNYSPENCQWITKGENTAKSNKIIQHRFADKGLYYGIDPNGNEYIFYNANSFAKEHGLLANNIRQVANGYKKTHKKWTFGFCSERGDYAKLS